ncbi:hypothetical protein [Nocardioides pocheonensis]|uniref:Uncharacterized protein n=1 Tax=Nocardioides pocheonensis TaxID=661485 RepID=A0A3N0GW16_9ACTN|nr:hypothetical protein [Nocardioides pocheonensis]RNM16627.1 hypothetical protein EFL26_03585 [Nocardioides pocheonensis]
MTHHDEDLVFRRGDVRSLPHTLSQTRHLTLTLVDLDAADGTAEFELHNPEAEPDPIAGDLIRENLDEVEEANRRRDRLDLPEKPAPVDTSTMSVEVLRCRVGEKLLIGDRVWRVAEISADQVTLRPGHDHETHSLVNTAEELEYGPEGIALAEALNTLDEGL